MSPRDETLRIEASRQPSEDLIRAFTLTQRRHSRFLRWLLGS